MNDGDGVNPDTPVQSLASADLTARRAMEDATRLAAAGLYRCRICNKVAPQEQGLVIAFAGNVLLAVCPTCMHAPIVIKREAHGISVSILKQQRSTIHVARSLKEVEGMRLATPNVKKVDL